MSVAQYALGDLDEATRTFEEAVRVNGGDVDSWLQLGKCYLYRLRIPQAAAALEVAALHRGATDELHSLLKARNWVANWQDREAMVGQIERFVDETLRAGKHTGVNALDFAELPLPSLLALSEQAHGLHASSGDRRLCCTSNDDWRLETPVLRVGFVSSDFGVHPVSTLLRGMLALLSGPDHPNVSVYCYSLAAASSWWRRNISRHVDHMVSLVGKNAVESAVVIRAHGVHVLIDLNGHTLRSGLSIFQYWPSPVQWSFLGYPMTTGSNAAHGIDAFVSDAVATPTEGATRQFTEKKLLLLPTHYIVNDHVQMLGHTLEGVRPRLPGAAGDRTFAFATFSNWQKMDPSVFSAWMAILARVPLSVLWFLRYAGHEHVEGNLKREADAHGIDGAARLVFSLLVPWVNHTHGKRAADLVLDTTLKNGHTTLLDALFAGVPVLTLESNRMSNRAGTSALRALDLQHALTVNSLKKYVDVAVFVATHPQVVRTLRAQIEARRLAYPLFDTSKYTHNFVDALQSAWAVTKSVSSASSLLALPRRRAFHVVPARRLSQLEPRALHVRSALDDPHTDDEYMAKVQTALESSTPVLLHIGSSVAKRGWWIVDVNDGAHLDFQLRMANLYAFPDASVAAIYALHVLEHNHFQLDDEVARTLREWRRVLQPGGALFVSVPDLYALASLFVRADMSAQDRFVVVKMMFGAQMDAHDVHKVGFFEPLLATFLENAGFCDIERVANFGLFNDTSAMAFRGAPISLNVHARACDKKDGVHAKPTPA